MNSSVPDESLESLAAKYDPKKVVQFKHRWGWTLATCLLVMVISVAGTLGVTRMIDRHFPLTTKPPPKADVVIAGTIDEIALLLIASDSTSSAIKVVSVTTNTITTQDLISGQFHPRAGALSPQRDQLVYIQEKDGHRKAVVFDLGSSISSPLETEKLREAAEGNEIEPCSWSQVVWSPDGARFCFFGCDKTTSVLVIVEAAAELTPVVIKKTESSQTPARQVFWLGDASLLYTRFDASTDETWVSQIIPKQDAVPQSVYRK